MILNTEPRWRQMRVEEYLARYSEAKSKQKELKAIVRSESDPLVKDYLQYRIELDRTSDKTSQRKPHQPGEGVAYAHACLSANSETRQASMIRAMALNGRTPEEIAEEFGTEPINVSVFLQLFFDVQPLLPFDAVLQGIVTRAQNAESGSDSREAQWLGVAYRSNWEVLQSVLFNRPLETPERVMVDLDNQMGAQLAIRACEFTESRMTSADSGREADLKNYFDHKRLALKAASQKLKAEPEEDPRFSRAKQNAFLRNWALIALNKNRAQLVVERVAGLTAGLTARLGVVDSKVRKLWESPSANANDPAFMESQEMVALREERKELQQSCEKVREEVEREFALLPMPSEEELSQSLAPSAATQQGGRAAHWRARTKSATDDTKPLPQDVMRKAMFFDYAR